LFEILIFSFYRYIPKQVFDTMGIFYLFLLNKLIGNYPFVLSLNFPEHLKVTTRLGANIIASPP